MQEVVRGLGMRDLGERARDHQPLEATEHARHLPGIAFQQSKSLFHEPSLHPPRPPVTGSAGLRASGRLPQTGCEGIRLTMPTVILKAHDDGQHIVLDEPFPLPANAPLMVTVIAPDDERSEWTDFGAQNLARARGNDEPEYTTADLKPQ